MIPGSANPLLLGQTSSGGGDFSIDRSLRFNSADSSYLNRTPSSSSNRKTWTWSGWVKRSGLGSFQYLFDADSGSNPEEATIRFWTDDRLNISAYTTSNQYDLTTTAKFRDTSGWYHIVVAFDTTNATADDRIKLYVNGAQITQFDVRSNPSENTDYYINNTIEHTIGQASSGNFRYLNAYLAEVNFIDGTALDPTSFGAFDDNGVWQAKDTAGLTFGTNGFRLKFADNSGSTATTLGKDTSGNSNNWTPNNLSITAGVGNDSLVDTPTNAATPTDTGAGGEVVGNYCTLNPLAQLSGTLSNGNLDYNLGSGTKFASGTIAVKSGKFHWEAKAVSGTTNGSVGGRFGFSQSSSILHGENGPFTLTWHATGGIQTFISGSYAVRLTGTNYADGDTLGCALDADSNIAYFYKNGSLAYTYNFSSLVPAGSQFLTPTCWNGSSGTPVWTYNFGARAFSYSARTNHKCLCTANLSTPTIADGSQYFDAKLYTGNGGTQTISGYGFSPDWLWIKSRSGADNHALQDVVRGVTRVLQTNTENAEVNASNTVGSFTSDGFTLAGGAGSTNGNNVTYAGWAWDGGTSTVTNNDGSIASQVRASAASGFSIVKYTANGTNGATIGHGLNAQPHFMIGRLYTAAAGWGVYHNSIGNTGALHLNNLTSTSTSALWWNNTSPSNSVFTIGTVGSFNTSGEDVIFYCFAPVANYSHMGKYLGNGSDDGPFVYTGFKPRFIITKAYSSNSNNNSHWLIYDTLSDSNPYNEAEQVLYTGLSNPLNTHSSMGIDILSNGFKLKADTSGYSNYNGWDYLYYAVAENPFQANGGLAR